ncbi:MAG: iron ABC transporter permease [Candidatus Coatesbacteria bacterium]|nr:iron ABC transporter permease [Candidatus Coatesbacteria bacterium]
MNISDKPPIERPSYLQRRRAIWSAWFIGLALLTLIAFMLGCSVGSVHIALSEVLGIILSSLGISSWAQTWSSAHELIVLKIRIPRAVMGLVVGSSLGAVGTAFQCILRNPLADPFIIGISGGAALGASLVIIFGISIRFLSGASLPLIAFLGAMLATVFIYRMSIIRGNMNPHTLILCGVILNSFLSAAMMMIYTAARPSGVHSLLLWLMGDLESTGEWLIIPIALMLAGTISLAFFARRMNAMTLGDETAVSLGVDVSASKRLIFIICAVIIGSAVSATGMVGFVGLVAPHLCRTLVSSDHRFVLPASSLLGAALVVFADTFGRWILSPAELPVGAVTALVGAPFFIYLLKRRSKIVWSD